MRTFTDFAKLKRFFLGCFVASIVIAALVAVITVLFGEFNEVTWRVFMTLGLIVLHTLVALCFIWDDSQRNTFYSLAFFVNVAFLILVVSFIVSIFNVWDILESGTTFKIYRSFFYIGFAALHADFLAKALHRESYLDAIVKANYMLIVFVLVMILGVIHADTLGITISSLYYRCLAALGIIDGTLSLLAVIFFKLYMHKHPDVQAALLAKMPAADTQTRRGVSAWVVILGIFLLYQIMALLFRGSHGWYF